jgi:hypothetical protein
MDGTQVMSLTALLPTIDGTPQYNNYQQRVAATDGSNSVYTVTGTRHAPGIMTPDTSTRIGDIVTTDAGNRIIVTGQNADGTFRARLVTTNEDPYIIGYVNRVQSTSYVANGAAALGQAAASGMTTPRTGTVGTGSNTYSPRSDAIASEQLGRVNGNRVVIEEGARPDANELRAAQGLADIGYTPTLRATANDMGTQGVRTADLTLQNGQRVDVYTPTTTSIRNISENIAKKKDQAPIVMVQSSLPSSQLESIAARVFGKPNAQPIHTIIFQSSNGQIIRFTRP